MHCCDNCKLQLQDLLDAEPKFTVSFKSQPNKNWFSSTHPIDTGVKATNYAPAITEPVDRRLNPSTETVPGVAFDSLVSEVQCCSCRATRSDGCTAISGAAGPVPASGAD
jgi:hypothetical protein